VPEFEDAVFSARPEHILPYPVRTQFGYHIIKITDRRAKPRRCSRQPYHQAALAEIDGTGFRESYKRYGNSARFAQAWRQICRPC